MEARTPLCFNIYSGSIPDKTHLEYMMYESKGLGIKNACFVMDRGFVTESNIQSMDDFGHTFVASLPGNLTEAMRLIDENRANVRKTAHWIKKHDIYGIKIPLVMYGLDLTAHLYYDTDKQGFDEKLLYSHIAKIEAELERMKRKKRGAKRYKELFVLLDEPKGDIDYKLDTAKVDERLARTGHFIIITNDGEMDSAEVLGIYRERDVIEKNFDQLKNHIDFKRMRTHWNSTTEGKIFVGFIALILRSYIMKKIKGSKETKNHTVEKVMLELRRIKTLIMDDGVEMLFLLTKLQKTLLETMEVPEDIFDL
jgi:transposase